MITTAELHRVAEISIPIEYNRGGARRQGLPQVKVHLTFDEPVLDGFIADKIPARGDQL